MHKNTSRIPPSVCTRSLPEVGPRDVLDVYAPLAHRLGLSVRLKRELEDAAFQELHPEEHASITRLIAKRLPNWDQYLSAVREEASTVLRGAEIDATVYARVKRPYSIRQKMNGFGCSFAEIYDLIGIRILVGSVPECYASLGDLHGHWTPVPGRFKDYIAAPKANQYQSLHSTVTGPDGKFLELQICTHAMHRRAEHGVAAHSEYKNAAHVGSTMWPGTMEHAALLHKVNDWIKENGEESNARTLNAIKFEVVGDNVTIIASDGRRLTL